MQNAIEEAQVDKREAKFVPKWLVQTWKDSKLETFLSSQAFSSSHRASFASDCYAMAVPSVCENEPVSFNDT